MCERDCPARVLKVVDGKVTIVQENLGNCLKCGHCTSVCRRGAVSLFNQTAKPLPSEKSTVESAILHRRSVRTFKGAIPNEELKELLNITRYAPSACNFRPIKFLVINRPKLTEIIAQLSQKVLEQNEAPAMFINVCKLQAKVDVIGRNAPHMVVAYCDEKMKTWGVDDASIALAEMELLATTKGYGTFWCGFMKVLLSSPAAMEFIGLKGMVCCGCMGMGVSGITYANEVEREDVDIKIME